MMKKKNISDRVIEFVLGCPTNELHKVTVANLAEGFNVNRCYLSRKFKNDKDFTLCEFLLREKLFRSMEILKEDPEITIRKISEILGFANSNYFIRIFKQHFGTSPGKYRECLHSNLITMVS